MRCYRYAFVALCVITLLASPVPEQATSLEPIRVAAGTVLTFHLQTRLNPDGDNETDLLPKGTVLQVRILDPINSKVNRDGTEFRGVIVSSIVSGDAVVLHADSQVRILLALLRSSSHPQGFRYELLLTSVMDHGKSYDLTASLGSSFGDDSPRQPIAAPENRWGAKARKVKPPTQS